MKQFAVIGLGNFGSYLARHLYDKGHDVLAIDKDSNQVQAIRDNVNQAVVADATDRKAMESLGMAEMDAVVISIGSGMSASILATLNIKDIGVKRVIAMSISEEHGRILSKIGASEVFFPEKDLAVSTAERLHNPNMLDYLPFIEGYSIIRLSPRSDFVGKALHEVNLINRYGVQVVAVKNVLSDTTTLIPTAKYVLKGSDIMILLGPNEALDKLKLET